MMRRLLIGGAGLVGLLVALAAYLQTADGFTRVVLPAIAAALDVRLGARSGRLHLDGRLSAQGLEVGDAAAGWVLSAEEVALVVVPSSLFSDRLRLRSLEARTASLRIEARPSAEDAADAARDASTAGWEVRLPVEIERAAVNDFRARLDRPGEPLILLGPLRLRFDDAGASGSGRLELGTELAVAPGDPDGYAASATIAGTIALAADGTPRSWGLDGDVELRPASDAAHRFTVATRGSTEGSALHASARVEAADGAVALGAVTASLQLPLAAPTGAAGGSAPRLAIELQGVSNRFVNPFIAALADDHLRSGQLDGTIQVEPAPEGDAIEVHAVLDARDLRLASAAAAAPPLRVQLREEGTWHGAPPRLALRAASASLARGAATVLELQLLQPTTISFAADGGGGAPQAAASAIRARADGLSLDALREWLALAELAPPAVLAGTTLDGALDLGIPPSGSPISATGTLNVRDAGPRRGGARRALLGRVDGRIRPASGIELTRLEVRLMEGTSELAAAQASGRVDWQPADLALDVTLNASDAAATLRAADFVADDTVQGGRLRLQGAVARRQQSTTTTLDGSLTVDGLRVSGPGGTIERNLTGTVRLALAPDGVRIGALELHTAAGRAPSTDACTATGTVPIAAGGSGRVDLRCTGLELALWLELSGLSGWSALGPTPVDGALAVRFDGAEVHAEGEQTLRLLDERGHAVPVSVRSAIDRSGSTTTFRFALQSSATPPDRVTIAGTLVAGTPRPRLRLTAALEALDLSPLARVLSARRAPGRGAAATAPSGPAERALRPADLPRWPIDVDAEITLGRVRYRSAIAEAGRLTARLDAARWTLDLSPTGLADGKVSGRLERRLEPAAETAQLTVRVDAVDLARFSESLREGSNERLEGTLTFSADLQGRAALRADLLEALGGPLDGRVTRGRVRGFNPMQFLAERTGVPQLGLIPLDTFDAVAHARATNGIATLEKSVVTSAAAHFEVSGRVWLDGQLDLTVRTLVGPGVARRMRGLGAIQRLVGRVENLAAIPIAIHIEGPIDQLRYRAAPMAPDLVDATVGIVGDTADGVGQIFDGVRGLFRPRRR